MPKVLEKSEFKKSNTNERENLYSHNLLLLDEVDLLLLGYRKGWLKYA